MKIKQKKVWWLVVSLLFFALLLTFVFFKQDDTRSYKETSPKDLSSQTKDKTSLSHNHDTHHSPDSIVHGQVGSAAKNTSTPDKIELIDFKNEVKNVLTLFDNYPQTRDKIIAIIHSPDPYLEAKISIEPHSLMENDQMKRGALKVLALKKLFELEKSKSQKLHILDRIVQESRDPTLVNMAKEAMQAINNDRPFFQDVLDGIQNLGLD